MAKLQAITQQDFSKGVVLPVNPYGLGKQHSVYLKNLILDEHGSVRTRDGTQVVSSSLEGAITATTIFAPGSGYAIGDVGVILGTLSPATYIVDSLSGSGVATLHLLQAGGLYNPVVFQTRKQTGAGAGLLITVTTVAAIRPIVKLYDFVQSAGVVGGGGGGGGGQAPTVAITFPANGANVNGLVIVTATASDDVAVVGVQFFLNGQPLGAEVLVSPYQVSWQTTNYIDGFYQLTAVARDANGNQATSAAVGVNVGNGGGTGGGDGAGAP